MRAFSIAVAVTAFAASASAAYLSGIDVSHYQGNIDWAAVKTTGISFAMCVFVAA
jgi:GH25 family lysozyme M1 (1,4-beta-N-acetylmuramidase)